MAPARPPRHARGRSGCPTPRRGGSSPRASTLEKGAPLFPRIERPMTWVDSHCHLPSLHRAEPTPTTRAGPGPRASSGGVRRHRPRVAPQARSSSPPRHADVRGDRRAAPARRVERSTPSGTTLVALARAIPTVVAGSARPASTSTTSTRRSTSRKPRSARRSQLAHELDRALVIHSRDAWDDTFRVLDDEGVPDAHGVPLLHRRARRSAARARRSARTSRSAASCRSRTPTTCAPRPTLTPIDRMLVETDAPYLAPVPHRGQAEQPAWVVDVGAALAAAIGPSGRRGRGRDPPERGDGLRSHPQPRPALTCGDPVGMEDDRCPVTTSLTTVALSSPKRVSSPTRAT